MEHNFEQESTEDKSKKKKRTCLTAGLIALAVIIVAGAIVAFLAVRFVKKAMGDFEKKYIEAGYSKVMTQVASVDKDIQGNMLYIVQTFDQTAGTIDGSVALLCQTAQIHSTITGDVDFKGQTLLIDDDAHIMGNLEVLAQSIVIKGQIVGSIGGTSQVVNVRRDLADKADIQCQSKNIVPIPESTGGSDTTSTGGK